jgi:CMP/dCMP kinase
MIITIDGPVASGKTTLGREVAQELKLFYVYTGLFYRALAYLLINKEIYKDADLENPKQEDLYTYLDPELLIYQYDPEIREMILFDNEDIAPFLKTGFIDKQASILSGNKRVRSMINEIVRNIARNFDVVVDGRDAGTVIFPGADIKFYITAEPEIRAKRWQHLQQDLGEEYTLEESLKAITERDERDKNKKESPLAIPEDAIIIDNSDLDVEQTLADALEKIDRNEHLFEEEK